MPSRLTSSGTVEQRLRVQERQLATIFNSSRDMMMLVKVEPGVLFRVVSVNGEYLSKVHSVGYRFTAEDFAGKTCDEVMALFGFPAAATASIRARYEQVIGSREVLAYDEDKNGPAGVFHGRTTITPLLDENGTCTHVLYATQDITAQRVAELERNRSEGMLRAILDHSFQFIGLLDPAGRLLRPNQTSLDAVGVSREEVVGKYFWDTPWWTHSPAEQARLREAVGRAAQGDFVRYETTHPTADGRVLRFDFSLKPVRDERGTVVALIPEGRDITESKHAEQALRESEEKFAKAFRASPQAMSIASMDDGRYLEINQAHQELFGFLPEEIVGRTPAELGILVDPAVTDRGIEEIRRKGRVKDLQLKARTRDGRVITVINNAELVHVGGRECALLSSRDVTAQLQAEQALRESEEKFIKAFKSSPDAISVHELDTGRYVEVNDGLVRHFGYSREEIIGRTPLELGIWPDQGERQDFVGRLKQAGSVRNHAVTIRRRSGELRECELSAEVFELGGRPHNVTVLRDVTEQLQAERALRSSEERFARAFRASPDAISISDLATGRILEVNEGFARLAGLPREEIIGRTAEELGFWGEAGGRGRMVEEILRTGSVRNLQVRVRSRQGEEGEFLVSGEQVEIGGRPCLVIVAHDIRDRIKAEQALRESEEKFAAAFRVSPDFSAIVDYETGQHIEVNDASVSFFGYSREEIIGKTALELGMISSAEPRSRMLELLNRSGKVRGMRVPARTRDGREVTVELSAEIVHLRGRKCILRISRDITAALQAEAALRESEEKFAKAFRSSPQALIITEIPSGRYIDVNLGFERITGYNREEIIGRTALEIGIWENLADREELMRRMQQDGWARDLEFVFLGKGGKRLVTRCSFELIDISGQKCLLSVIEDITDRRRAEEEKATLEAQLRQNQKLEALGTLAGGIAHDFNNILTAIIVNQELALMDIHEPADLRRRLEEIGQASGRAKELVRQILTFSRQQPHEKIRQRLQMIVREALGLLRASLPATIEILQDLAPEAPPVQADASQIHQVVMNLCTNAAHAMQERGGRLTVRLERRQLDEAACRALPGLVPGTYAQLTVADTGHGMDAATLTRIFEPFFTTKGPGEGTGLGLPMVHGIVQNHGGGIFVQSLPGTGTTFDLYFPEASGTDSRAPLGRVDIVPGRGESVLVVDDEQPICFAVGAMLRRIGYRVETFTDPTAALERLRADPSHFQLLLTDRTMPHITGPALIVRMREWRPGLPALLMSGHNSPGGSDEVLPPETDYGLVAKPLDIADLSRAVREALTARKPS